MTWIAVAVGGGIGAVARHALNATVAARVGSAFPYGIFLVNLIGCLAIGAIAGVAASGRIEIPDTARTFLVVGILGGFTTFSTFSLDTYTLLRAGQVLPAVTNAAGQTIGGLVAVALGFALASRL